MISINAAFTPDLLREHQLAYYTFMLAAPRNEAHRKFLLNELKRLK